MNVILDVLIHVLLIGTLLLFLAFVAIATVREADPREKLMRVLALVAGAMVTLGAQAAGTSIAFFTVDALAGARAPSAVAALGTSVVPALTGAVLGFYIVRVFQRNDRMAMRVMGFIAVLAGTAFLQVYAQATQTNGLELGAAALPNVAFVTGIILTVVFTYDPDRDARDSALASLGRLVSSRRARSGDSSSETRSAFSAGRDNDPFA